MRVCLISGLALSCLLAQESLGTLLQRARTAREGNDLPAALAAYNAMLAQSPEHETALLERAQVLAWLGRYDAALADYGEFKRRYPGRGLSVDLRHAQVLAWSGQIPQALTILAPWVARQERQAVLDDAIYRSWTGALADPIARLEAWLSDHPEDGEVRLARARMHAWLSRWAQARADYQTVLQQDPQNAEALLGLARIQLWSGNVSGARQQFGMLRSEDTHLPEARVLDAAITSAEGHPRRARQMLLPLLQGGSAQRDAAIAVREHIEAQGLWAELHQGRTTTSEGLTTTAPGLTLRVPMGDGRVDLGAHRPETTLNDQVRRRTVLEVGFAYPLGAAVALDWGASRSQRSDGPTDGSWRGGITVRPAPGLSLRADLAESLLDATPRAIDRGGSIRTQDLSAAWNFGAGRNTLSVGGGRGQLEAGSRRTSFFGSFEHRLPLSRGDLRGGATWRGFGYSETLPLGFFNPERYRYFGLFGAGALRRYQHWEMVLDARAGRQTVNGGTAQIAWGYGLMVNWKLQNLPLALEAGWSESHAGLPVVDPADPKSYSEKTLQVGLRLFQRRTSRCF